MGTILPKSVTNPQTNPAALPNRALFNNGSLNLGAALGDVGDILRGLGGPEGSWDSILQQRAREDAATRAEAINNQRYQEQLREQQFRNNLATQTLRLRMMQAMGRDQVDPNSPSAVILGSARPNVFQSGSSLTPAATTIPYTSTALNALSNLTGNATASPSSQPQINGPASTQSTAPNLGVNNNINGLQPSVVPKFITPDTIPEAVRDKYNRLAEAQPELAKELLLAANHQIPISDVTKAYRNPADVIAIRNFVPLLNPHYDPKISQNVQQFQRDINNQKSPVNVNFRSDQELANQILQQIETTKKLPSTGFTAGNKVLDKVEDFFGSTSLSDYYKQLDAIAKEVERGRLQGRPTVSSIKSLTPLYDASQGPKMLTRAYNRLLEGVDKRLYNQIYNAVNATKGYGGYQSYHLDPSALKRLHAKGYIRVDSNGAVVPLVNSDILPN